MHSSFFIFLSCIFNTFHIGSAFQKNDFAIVGYVPDWRLNDIPFNSIIPQLTHLILFSIETDPKGNLVELSRLPSKQQMKEIRQLCTKTNTNLLVSLGGNGRSNGFPVVAVSDRLRKQFVKNTLKFVKEYELDGIDLNWEYPQTENQWMGLFKIIELLRKKQPRMILTLAFSPGQERIFSSPVARDHKVKENVNLFLMMCYDNRSEKMNKHSTFDFAMKCISNARISHIIPPKLVLGLPFYARHVKSGEPKTYQEIVGDLRDQGNADDVIKKMNIYGSHFYNGYDLIVKKTTHAMKRKIGGIMIWENGQDVHDDELSLLGAISRTVSFIKGKQRDSGVQHGEL